MPIRVAADGCMEIDASAPDLPFLWAPMIKTSQSSYDGWLWTLQQPDLGAPPQFPPPLISQSAFTGPLDSPLPWYPTGSILQRQDKKMRNDGRAADQLRPVVITPRFMKHAEGSALIEVAPAV